MLTVNSENIAEELFHLRDDPGQANNLVEDPQYSDLVSRLKTKFLKYNDHDNATREPRTTEAFRASE